MAFADDIVILAENTEDLIFLAENFINECKKTGLGVNDENTKTIHFWEKLETIHLSVLKFLNI